MDVKLVLLDEGQVIAESNDKKILVFSVIFYKFFY